MISQEELDKSKEVAECIFCGWKCRLWQTGTLYKLCEPDISGIVYRTPTTYCIKCRTIESLKYYTED